LIPLEKREVLTGILVVLFIAINKSTAAADTMARSLEVIHSPHIGYWNDFLQRK